MKQKVIELISKQYYNDRNSGHMNSHTCFFIGHRDAPDTLLPALDELVERHITEYGVQEFTVGRYGRFDYLAAQAVLRAKGRHPDVRLVYLRPYHPAEQPIETPKASTALSILRAWSMYQNLWQLSALTATWWITATI